MPCSPPTACTRLPGPARVRPGNRGRSRQVREQPGQFRPLGRQSGFPVVQFGQSVAQRLGDAGAGGEGRARAAVGRAGEQGGDHPGRQARGRRQGRGGAGAVRDRGVDACAGAGGPAPWRADGLEPVLRDAADHGGLPVVVHGFAPTTAEDLRTLAAPSRRHPRIPLVVGRLGGLHWMDAVEPVRDTPARVGECGLRPGSGVARHGAAAATVLALATGMTKYSGALPAVSVAGGLAAAALVYALAWRRGIQAGRFVLVGVGIGVALSAVVQLRRTAVSRGQRVGRGRAGEAVADRLPQRAEPGTGRATGRRPRAVSARADLGRPGRPAAGARGRDRGRARGTGRPDPARTDRARCRTRRHRDRRGGPDRGSSR